MEKIAKELSELEIPAAPNPKDAQFASTPKDPNAKIGQKFIAFNRAIRKDVEALDNTASRLKVLAENSRAVQKAGDRMTEAFAKLFKDPFVDGFFKDMFGMAWLQMDANTRIASGIASDAKKQAKAFEDEVLKRRKFLKEHTTLLKKTLPELKVDVPTDIK